MNNAVKENEDFIKQRLVNPNKAEAHAWLTGHSNKYRINLGELRSNEESLELVGEFYAAGAIEVTAVEIDKYEGEGENTGKLIVVLPENKMKRTKILDLCSRIAQEQGFDPVEDFGQHSVFLMLD